MGKVPVLKHVTEHDTHDAMLKAIGCHQPNQGFFKLPLFQLSRVFNPLARPLLDYPTTVKTLRV